MPGASKHFPVSMRLPEGDLAIIDRAADLKGRSRTDFVREAAVKAAEETILDSTIVRMAPDAFRAFEAAIASEGEIVPEFVEVLRRKRPWR